MTTLDPTSTTTGASAATPRPGGAAGLCVFDLAGVRFGLDVGLVGEVIAVERLLAVPHAPRGIEGLFNLRGVPVALIDLATVLELPAGAAERGGATIALVLRAGAEIVAAIRVTAVRGVVPAADAALVPADRNADHPAVLGFVSTPALGVISVLDGPAIPARLARFRAR